MDYPERLLQKNVLFQVSTTGRKAAFIMYPTGGGQRILGGDLKFLEQKKGGYENCLNISGGMLIFCKILSSFCNGFKR